MIRYPVHDKLKAHKAEADTIGAFLDWLSDEGIHLARYQRIEGYRNEQLLATFDRPDQLIGGFLGISPDDLEREKRAMLDEIRVAQEARTA